ncbi:MAG: isoleucine--tRNA ligase [Candidatus Eremiobacteraeota bacterium]|nr:isoleucine--tRNA ligase [Candidatus Eremiobacteraeota bacterium]
MSENERDYRATLNLPQTEFPMRADLPKREPGRVAWWNERGTFQRRLDRNKAEGNPHWILHDGPPYANGELHMGHFLNMVLKDVFVKIALLDGKQTPFVPGWDMHGLPIELETLKHLGIKDFHAIDPLELREKCKERALYWLDRQRTTRVRMGNFGDWQHPYMTIAPAFEATIVETLATLAEKEQLYRGLRSTLWCIHDETALAEAEIEYEPKTSPSVYVRFRANDAQRAELLAKFAREDGAQPLGLLIWTTTPWTLPANVAIALRTDAEYGLYRVGEELLVLAAALAPKALGDAFESAEKIGIATGAQLDGLSVRHPFMDRDSLIVLADYVELETGTGAVHTAPGHGADDFETGVKYGLPILNPVDARGIFTQEAGPYAGMHIWKANKQIVEDLRASGALWRMHEYEHSYPHCWRCHNPVIFRATAQWFIALDMNHLRQKAIDAIAQVAYTPEWGQTRQSQMIETHPEWCVSRQRTWGTPIPALICKACNESFLEPAVARRAAARFREAGAGTWWSDPIETFAPAGTVCPKCASTEFEKEKNIVDIWFESGVSHFVVLGKADLPWPSDLVLEGGDQYRGWFRSSLLTAVAVKGTAPYKHVVKNGWVNDEQGRMMSKSKGTGIDAKDAMEKWGADVLRLWAASVEFVDDVRFGPKVVDQVGNVYRNVRNRIRFMLSNLYDFTTADIVPREKLEPLDALACDVTDAFADAAVADYHAFGVHDAYLRIVEFDRSMSSLYLDALKDPLYSRDANDPRRRSAQSALLYILRRLLAVTAPVLSFTSEEAWQALSEDLRGSEQSVFDLPLSVGHGRENADAVRTWDRLRALRGRVAASTDPRDFEARVGLTALPAITKELAALGDGLREALVVSEVSLGESEEGDAEGIGTLTISAASGAKCKRCWKFRDLGTNPSHAEICSDCALVVAASGT